MVPKQALLSSETQPTTDRKFRDNVMNFNTFYDCLKYNPKSEKVGTVWKTQIKKESSDF